MQLPTKDAFGYARDDWMCFCFQNGIAIAPSCRRAGLFFRSALLRGTKREENNLEHIIKALASLYDNQASAQRVAHDANLDTSEINFDGSASECWRSIIERAEEEGRLFDVLAVASREYPHAVERMLEDRPGDPMSSVVIELRRKLADIYKDNEDARRVALECGLPVASISFGKSATITWHSVLTQAKHAHKRHMLLSHTTVKAQQLNTRAQCGYCTAVHKENECPKCGAPRPMTH